MGDKKLAKADLSIASFPKTEAKEPKIKNVKKNKCQNKKNNK